MRWRAVALDGITDVVTKGTTPTTLGKEFTDEGITFIKAEALNGESTLDAQGFSFIDEETHERLKRSILKEDDVLLTIAGAQIGKCGYVKAEHLPANTNQAVGIIRINKSKAVPRFVYYFFKQPQTFSFVQSLGAQAAQPNLNLTMLRRIEVPLPSLAQQERIADLLSAYDDLIENNLRQMALLEESARLLYREWFVRLRFPGHEHTRIVNGVPAGWEKKSLGDVLTLNYGKALKESERVEGPFPVYGSSGVVGTHNEALVKGPGIIVGRKGNVGSIYWTESDFWPIDTVYFIESSQSNYFLFHSLQHQNFLNSDGAVPGLNRNYAYSLPVLLPKQTVREQFEQTVTSIYEQVTKLRMMNEKLRAARDLLLPRLMSGEIAV